MEITENKSAEYGDKNKRQRMIERTSTLGIVVNILIAAMKIIVGLAASSMAIVSEGVNNASDAGTSLLTLVGAKLSSRHPDEKHPFGYGRVEYLTSLVVSILICYTGIALLRESAEGIFQPGEMEISVLALALVAVSAVIKFFLGIYTIRVGEKTDSSALNAVGVDCRNDSVFSVITIGVGLLYLKTGFSLDAYAGILFALVIVKAGFDTLKETVTEILGRPGEKDLADQIYQEIWNTEGISNAADMMLHNYGPDAWSGSVNVELDHKLTVGEAYDFLHDLQLRIMYQYKVVMVFGIYAVDNDTQESRELRRVIGEFTRAQEHVKSFHAVYADEENHKIYCDFVVDYKLRDWDALEQEFLGYMGTKYPDYSIELTVETEYV